MAGFGAGFAKAVSGSLEAAGKLHQEEQLREREYQRARADKLADRAQDRAWQLDDRAAAEELTRKYQEAQFRTNIENYSMDKDGNLLYTSPLTGEVKPVGKDSPMVYSWERRATRVDQEDARFAMDVEKHRSGMAVDEAQIYAYRNKIDNASSDDYYQGVGAMIDSLAKNYDVKYAGGKLVQRGDKVVYQEPGKDASSRKAVTSILNEVYPGQTQMTLRRIAQVAQGSGPEARKAKETMARVAQYLTFGTGSK